MSTYSGQLAQWWLDRPLRSKGLAVLAPPVLVLIITVATSFIVGRYQAALVQTPSGANTADFNTLQTIIEVVEIAGLLIGVIGGVTAMVLFVRSIVRRIGTVGLNAQRLGVSESLLPVPAAADEIGELDEQLREASTLLTQRSTDLVRAHTAALEAAAEADELLARISHELRTPLTAVMGFGQLIDRSQLLPEDADAIEQILSAGGHMLRIIEEGRRPVHTPQAVPLDLRAVEVGPLVHEVQSLLSPLTAGRDLTVTCEGAKGAVLADYYRLKQVLINLISNAVKFNRVGGSIVVTCKPGEVGRLRLAVTDTGEGIAAELIDRVFVPFERLDAEARGIEGTGIGLSLSKTFVEAMGGIIGVETSVGRGSTFWVDLPEAPGRELVTESGS